MHLLEGWWFPAHGEKPVFTHLHCIARQQRKHKVYEIAPLQIKKCTPCEGKSLFSGLPYRTRRAAM